MRKTLAFLLTGIVFGLTVGRAAAPAPTTVFTFRDVGDEAGVFPHVAGIAGHTVAWGDADGNGWPDLYVATFGGHPYGSKRNMLLLNDKGKFRLDKQKVLQVEGRAGGGVFADLDNDGDLDLYLSNHAIDAKAYKQPHYGTPNFLFRNDGGGKFTDVSVASGSRPEDFRGRSVTVLDYDGDGQLDLLIGEGFLQGGKGRSKLFRNLGGLKFKDVTAQVGLPADKNTGMGVAAGDLNGDGWPDIIFTGRVGNNRLFVNDAKGKFRELPKKHGDFAWRYTDTPDDTPCGVCFGDVNRDGRLDILIGQHFDRPWFTGGVPVRLYLNRGVRDGWPAFEEVTAAAGLKPLPMKGPHVEIQDFDNDGWPDVYVGIVKFAAGKPYPLIFKNRGARNGLPRFTEDALAVNDFPTERDRKEGNVVTFFDRLNKEKKIIYMAPGPSCDFDRDGRLDLFLANWWVDSRSLLLRNETKAGNWLQVTVQGAKGVNRMGIGAVVRVYDAGKLGQAEALVTHVDIAAGYGYASGQEALAHIGLGKRKRCDVRIILPHGKGTIDRRGVACNQRININE